MIFPLISLNSIFPSLFIFIGTQNRILASFTPVGNNTLNITIENVVNGDTESSEMDVFIRKGGIDAPTQWANVGTFDWPDTTYYLIHDLIPNTHYGIKLMRFEKYTDVLESSISSTVYVPVEGERITFVLFHRLLHVLQFSC